MKYYIDIKLLSDSEIGLGFLWKKVYTQVHLALVEAKNESIALSFPKYGSKAFPMGDYLRIFAQTSVDLDSLKLSNWLQRLSDYIEVSETLETPTVHKFVHFKRRQFKANLLKRAEKQALRRGISIEEALKHYEGMEDKNSKLPFIMIKSLSSNQELKLFIEKRSSNSEVKGVFNTFGLSKTATVPWF